MSKFNNYGFDVTEQLVMLCDEWLKFKGIASIETYGEQVVYPNELPEIKLLHLSGELGYEPFYLYEHLYYTHLKKFTISKYNFLDFYFNTGDDKSQRELRRDIGNSLVNHLLSGEPYTLPTAESLFNNCGYIRMSYCEEVVIGHPLSFHYENNDLDFNIDIKLI